MKAMVGNPGRDDGQTHTPWVKRAGELSAKALKNCQRANSQMNLIRFGLIALLLLLAIPTGFAMAYLFSWPFVAGYVLAVVMHLMLAAAVHGVVLGKRTGHNALAATCAVCTAILVFGFLLAAYSRQKMLVENGLEATLAWLAAILFWLIEIAGPIITGFEHAVKSDNLTEAKEDRAFYHDHYALIDASPDDAPGEWDDQIEDVRVKMDRLPGPSSRTQKEEREFQRLQRWLDALCVYHPYNRYRSGRKTTDTPEKPNNNGNGRHDDAPATIPTWIPQD